MNDDNVDDDDVVSMNGCLLLAAFLLAGFDDDGEEGSFIDRSLFSPSSQKFSCTMKKELKNLLRYDILQYIRDEG